MPCYEIDGVTPVVHPTAFVHPQASLIGDVIVGPECYIGPFASLRGDFGRITVGEGSNVQDGAVIHAFPGADAVLDPHSHIGHGAILHGCHIGSYALIGIGSTVLDGAEVGEDALIGAGALVTAGTKVGPRMLAHGNPAREQRELDDETVAWKRNGTHTYVELTKRARASLREVPPLAEIEVDRRRVTTDASVAQPLHELRARTET